MGIAALHKHIIQEQEEPYGGQRYWNHPKQDVWEGKQALTAVLTPGSRMANSVVASGAVFLSLTLHFNCAFQIRTFL